MSKEKQRKKCKKKEKTKGLKVVKMELGEDGKLHLKEINCFERSKK